MENRSLKRATIISLMNSIIVTLAYMVAAILIGRIVILTELFTIVCATFIGTHIGFHMTAYFKSLKQLVPYQFFITFFIVIIFCLGIMIFEPVIKEWKDYDCNILFIFILFLLYAFFTGIKYSK